VGEQVLAAEPSVRYPVCGAGEGACPPEDCDGCRDLAAQAGVRVGLPGTNR
jgi:hypothetical protein